MLRSHLLCFAAALALSGCSTVAPLPPEPSATKPAAPAIPEEYSAAANALLGSDATVLLFGDLAKNGAQELLVANVLPNTPRSTVAGTVVTRAVIAEKDDGHWKELLRVDEYLKNPQGYLGLTPLQPVAGWKLQYENDPDKGLYLYFTPIKSGETTKTLPIAVRWNPAKKRYQSMDLTYEHFLGEAPTLETSRSRVR